MPRILATGLPIACLPSAVPARQAPSGPHEIVLLGTYHFANPGLDEHNVLLDDYSTQLRQEEILAVVERLVAYRPAKVFVEVPPDAQPQMDERFQAFASGRLDPSQLGLSETYQLGFRVAEELGHERVHCMDARGEWLGRAVRATAEKHGIQAYLDDQAKAEIETREEERLFASRSVLENLIALNERSSIRSNHSFYNEVSPLVVSPSPSEDGLDEWGSDVGARLVGRWYERNIRMYGNILRALEPGDERALVIVGQGHVRILEHMFEDHPAIEVLPANRILDDDGPRALDGAALEPFTYYFRVEGGSFVPPHTGRDGTRLLLDELAASQFVALGEYHGSSRISDFTAAAVGVLSELGCRHLGLEIGPTTGRLLRRYADEHGSALEGIRAFHRRYRVPIGDELRDAVPFFSSEVDAKFLDAALESDWHVIGLDQEFIHGYLPLLDALHESLPRARRRALDESFLAARDAVVAIYESGEDARIASRVHDSAEVDAYLRAGAAEGPDSQAIARAVRATTRIYRDNDLRRYYEANAGRIQHMKDNLREGARRTGFDPTQDRLLLKMGGFHTGRGLSPLSLYELGNTLSEIAELNGSKSLHIQFSPRFWSDDDGVADLLGEVPAETTLLSVARRDEWTLIDLRPLRDDLAYYGRYSVDAGIARWFESYDWVVIPPVDHEPPHVLEAELPK